MKDLIPNIEVFKELANEHSPEKLTLTDSEMLTLFTALWNNFSNCSVAFDTKHDFYRKFYNILWDEADYYIDKLKKYREIRGLTNDQLIKEYTNISNVANNNNKVVESPLTEIIPYITTQATSTSTSNILGAITRALKEYKNNELKYFLNKFNNLFLDLFGGYVVHYSLGEVD